MWGIIGAGLLAASGLIGRAAMLQACLASLAIPIVIGYLAARASAAAQAQTSVARGAIGRRR